MNQHPSCPSCDVRLGQLRGEGLSWSDPAVKVSLVTIGLTTAFLILFATGFADAPKSRRSRR